MSTGTSKRHIWLSLLLASLLLAACSNGYEGTLIADHESASTAIAALKTTATVRSARIQTTINFSETQISAAATRSQFLKATLIMRGTDQGYLDEFQRSVALGTVVPPTLTPRPPEGSSQQMPEITQAVAPTQPELGDWTTATGVGADDCAQGNTDSFSTDSEAVYIVATARNIEPGTQLATRWFRAEEQVAFFSFAPDYAIDDVCIWFFIDQTDVEFTPGNWSVIMEINGQAASPPMRFTISQAAAVESTPE